MDGAVVDPYRLLPPVSTDLPRKVVDALEADDDLENAQGGRQASLCKAAVRRQRTARAQVGPGGVVALL